MLGWTIWINILLFWFDSAVAKSKQFMAVELYLYMGETGLSKKNHLGKISKWWWWWWLGHNDNDDGLTMTSCVSNNDDDEEEEHKDSNTIMIMMVAWRWLNVLAIINNYWTRLSKISWFVCGEQINIVCWSWRLRQMIDLQDTDKSRYFAITKFSNCFNIQSPRLVFLMNILGKWSDLPFSGKSDCKKE